MELKILNIDDIKKYYDQTIFSRGLKYFNSGNVIGFKYDLDFDDSTIVNALVQGSEVYIVTFNLEEDYITEESLDHATCTCPYYTQGFGDCKHIVSAILKYYDEFIPTDVNIKPDKYKSVKASKTTKITKSTKATKSKKTPEKKEKQTNLEGQSLLELYVKNKTDVDVGKYTIKPHISNIEDKYPQITLTVGRDKFYVVRSIEKFILNVMDEEEVSYGKNLSFVHKMDQFDENSKNLICILSKGLTYTPSYSYNYYYAPKDKAFVDSGRAFQFDGNTISLFFETYLGQTITLNDWGTKEVTLVKENPNLSITLKKSGEGATIVLNDTIKAYGNVNAIFILFGDKFYSCDAEFSKNIFPILDNIKSKIYIGKNDLPTLGSVVLPAMKEVVNVKDTTDVAEKYTPDECTPNFYFDIDDNYDNVVLILKFQYRDIQVSEKPTAEQLSQIKQNVQVEERAKNYLKQYFIEDKKRELYTLHCDEDIFLTEQINDFKFYGEVFLSQKFDSKFISTKKKPVLGVSVSNNLLSLDIDTGEFPAEELELLYNSFLKKKKYHKLRDGRFLFLEGSGFEKVAEISHMLQLTEKDLKKSTIKLPAYRSLYLDSVLTEASDDVSLKRNKDFSNMMKNFKSVKDSDYQPSDDLNAELRPYQVLGFQWLKTLESYNFGGILADEMGLGKTVQMITYLLSIKQTGHKLPNLIICPASLLFNWRDELNRFAPSLSVMLLIGNAKERQEQLSDKLNKKIDIWVTSYDLIKRDRVHYEDKKFYTCILDEGQHIKNQTTIVSRSIKILNSKQRFVLTGTPIENRLSELWNLFDFLMPGYLFNHNTFLNKLEKPIVNSDEPQARQQLNLLVQPFILRRLKKDVLKELPDKMEYVRKINLTEEERKIYIAANKKILGEVTEETSSIQILAMLTHLRQLCCDPNLCFDNYKGESSKLEACIELCVSMVENGHKILLFSQFTSMLDIIRERLNKLKLSNLTIEGSTTKIKRAEYVKQFQEGNTDIFLISLKAGGTGLNLTKADVVIHYDPWWNQAAQNQATDRAHRMGQEEIVQVYKLITDNTIEEKILKLQEKKASLMESIFQETGDTKLSKEDIIDLLEL